MSLSQHFEKLIKIILKLQNITEREAEVLAEIRQGKTNLEIAKALFIEEGTVKIHIQHIYKKLNVKNRLSLISKLSENSE